MFETLEKTTSRAELAVLQGEELPRCEISLGLPGWINLIAAGGTVVYGGLSGFDNADYLMVPQCPAEAKVRRKILQEIAARGDVSLKEVRRTELYILLIILCE